MKVGIVSGYFAPLHEGHLEYIESARRLVDQLVVIVNNDTQLVAKKGFIVISEKTRMAIMNALRDVNEAYLSIDVDETVNATLKCIKEDFPTSDLYFFNDGDGQLKENVPGITYVSLHHPKINASSEIIRCIQEGCNVQQSV